MKTELKTYIETLEPAVKAGHRIDTSQPTAYKWDASYAAPEFKTLDTHGEYMPSGYAAVDRFVASLGARFEYITPEDGNRNPQWDLQADVINMFPPDAFTSPAEYVKAVFHELTHWSGATGRAERMGGALTLYSAPVSRGVEESTAELCALLLAKAFGIESDTEWSINYIYGWAGSPVGWFALFDFDENHSETIARNYRKAAKQAEWVMDWFSTKQEFPK